MTHFDKVLHFGGGMVLSLVFGLSYGPIARFATACVIGLLKELRDEYTYGGGDWKDFAATAAGGALAALLLVWRPV